MSNFLESKKVKVVLLILGSLIVLLLVFGLGITIGYDRANFTSNFDQNYYRNFNAGMPGGPMGSTMTPVPVNEHGIFGTVIDVSTSTISVKDQSNNEHSIEVSSGTIIREMNDMILVTDIKIGDQLVVIGEPNPQGQVYARFIRVFTASSSMPTSQGQ
jgi:hypothetical protein